MVTTDGLIIAYFTIGVVAVVALVILSRREGIRMPGWGWLILLPSLALALPLALAALLIAIAIWPLYLLGLFICWLDGQAVDESESAEDTKRPNKAPEPTPGTVTPRASSSSSK